MANIASAKKRILTSNKKELQNKTKVSKLKTMMKKYDAAIETNDIELSENLFTKTAGFVDNLAHKGVLHKNNAARKKSSLNKKLSDLKNKPVEKEVKKEEKAE